MPNSDKKTPLASTYQQVLENMEAIAALGDLSNLPMDMKEIAETVKKLQDSMIKPPEGGTNDVVTTDDGSKVLGNHLNTGSAEENTDIADYKRGVTFEVKNVKVIGLSKEDGMTGAYCMVMTVNRDTAIEGEPESIEFVPFQVAFATEGAFLYIRHTTSDGEWGKWTVLSGGGGGNEIISATQPTGQKAGDYWCQPIA